MSFLEILELDLEIMPMTWSSRMHVDIAFHIEWA